MENLELKIFREAAKAGSLSKAAENLCYAQSNMTAHIKKLERELDTELFVRHNKGIRLTSDGEKLLSYADAILDLLDEAVYELQHNKPELHIGAAQTIAARRLPTWLALYRKQFPKINVSVITDSQDQLTGLLRMQAIDCAFVERSYITKQVRSILSFDEKLCVIAPLGWNKRMLKDSALITNKIPACPYRRILLEWSAVQTSEALHMIEFDTLDAIINSVSLGLGISLLPYFVVSGRKDISIFEIQDFEMLHMDMVVCTHRRSKNVLDLKEVIESLI